MRGGMVEVGSPACDRAATGFICSIILLRNMHQKQQEILLCMIPMPDLREEGMCFPSLSLLIEFSHHLEYVTVFNSFILTFVGYVRAALRQQAGGATDRRMPFLAQKADRAKSRACQSAVAKSLALGQASIEIRLIHLFHPLHLLLSRWLSLS